MYCAGDVVILGDRRFFDSDKCSPHYFFIRSTNVVRLLVAFFICSFVSKPITDIGGQTRNYYNIMFNPL